MHNMVNEKYVNVPDFKNYLFKSLNRFQQLETQLKLDSIEIRKRIMETS